MERIYLDNAATSYPKSPGLSKAISQYIEYVGSNVGRGLYETSLSAGETVYHTRELLCDMFNFDNPLNVAFTLNITQSLNIIIKGLLKKGDHVIVSSMEHNAIMRPLTSLIKDGVEYTRIPCSIDGTFNPNLVYEYIKPNTKLFITLHASNVCGTIMPVKEIGEICKQNNIFFVLDTAQTAGVLNINFKEFNLSGLAFTGHKGLLGPQGIGGLILNDDIAEMITPLIEGGTGSLSESESQPNYMPDKFESGTLNIPGIYGLNASINYLNKIGIDSVHEKECFLTKNFMELVGNIEDVRICGNKNFNDIASVVSLDFPDLDNSEVAHILDRDYGIMTRVGLHCAPSAHKTIETYPKGTVRFSFGYFNTKEEIEYTVKSIYKTINYLK